MTVNSIKKRGRGRPAGSKSKPKIPFADELTKIALSGDSDFSFASNPRLKKAGVRFALTAQQKAEYFKCADDPVYFIEKYIKFMTDDGLQTVSLYPFQCDQIQTYHDNRMVIVKTARQVGKTTVTIGYLIHYILFNKEKTVGVLAQKEKVATEILNKIKQSFEHIPLWMQQGIVAWNATSIILENGCRILSESTSTGAIRGFTIHLLYLDEFAHVPSHVAEDFITSVYPTISSSKISKIIITSTPLGLNLFYKFWMDAKKEFNDPTNWNGFKTIEVHWSSVPGRDQAWANQQKRILGDRKYAQDVEAEFLGSSNTLIIGKKLSELAFVHPTEVLFDKAMAIYERPISGHSYALSGDPSEGKGLDYSCFTLFDITSAPYKVVARFRDNTVDDVVFASYLVQAAHHYNNAYVIVENNEIGALVLHHVINDHDYDNIFYSYTEEHKEITVTQAARAMVPGVRTSKKVKSQGCLRLKTLVETDQIIITDFETISELSTFVLQKNKTWAAEEGYNDDTTSTLWLFAWLTIQPFFRDISDLNLRARLYEEREKQMLDHMPPPPVLSLNDVPKPKLEVSDGVVWIDSSMSYDEALRFLNGTE
jgi:hypothetical protein